MVAHQHRRAALRHVLEALHAALRQQEGHRVEDRRGQGHPRPALLARPCHRLAHLRVRARTGPDHPVPSREVSPDRGGRSSGARRVRSPRPRWSSRGRLEPWTCWSTSWCRSRSCAARSRDSPRPSPTCRATTRPVSRPTAPWPSPWPATRCAPPAPRSAPGGWSSSPPSPPSSWGRAGPGRPCATPAAASTRRCAVVRITCGAPAPASTPWRSCRPTCPPCVPTSSTTPWPARRPGSPRARRRPSSPTTTAPARRCWSPRRATRCARASGRDRRPRTPRPGPWPSTARGRVCGATSTPPATWRRARDLGAGPHTRAWPDPPTATAVGAPARETAC